MIRTILGAALCAAFVGSCVAPGGSEIGFKNDEDGVGIYVQQNPSSMHVDAPVGTEVTVQFHGINGDLVEPPRVFPGAGVSTLVGIPAGTVDISITIQEPRRQVRNENGVIRPEPYQSADLFVVPRSQSPNERAVIAHFKVDEFQAPSADAQWERVRQAVVAGPGARLSRKVDVLFYARAEYHAGGIRLTVADHDDTFESLRLELNGNPAYATLDANSLVYDAGRGWSAVEIQIPYEDLFSDGGFVDRAVLHVDTVNSSLQTVEIDVDPQAN